MPTSGAPLRSPPHPPHQPGSCRNRSCGSATCQRRPRMPSLPTGLTPGPAPQRPRRRLGKRRIQRWRLRKIPTVLPPPPPQLGVLRFQHIQPRCQPLHQRPQLTVFHGKVLITRTSVSNHHTMISAMTTRSTSHADTDLTSYDLTTFSDLLTTPKSIIVVVVILLPGGTFCEHTFQSGSQNCARPAHRSHHATSR